MATHALLVGRGTFQHNIMGLTFTPTRTSVEPRVHLADPLHCGSTPRDRDRRRSCLHDRPSFLRSSWKPCKMYALSSVLAICIYVIGPLGTAKNDTFRYSPILKTLREVGSIFDTLGVWKRLLRQCI